MKERDQQFRTELVDAMAFSFESDNRAYRQLGQEVDAATGMNEVLTRQRRQDILQTIALGVGAFSLMAGGYLLGRMKRN